jgi:hypothetical protein
MFHLGITGNDDDEPSIHLEKPRKTMENSVRIAGLWAEI